MYFPREWILRKRKNLCLDNFYSGKFLSMYRVPIKNVLFSEARVFWHHNLTKMMFYYFFMERIGGCWNYKHLYLLCCMKNSLMIIRTVTDLQDQPFERKPLNSLIHIFTCLSLLIVYPLSHIYKIYIYIYIIISRTFLTICGV